MYGPIPVGLIVVGFGTLIYFAINKSSGDGGRPSPPPPQQLAHNPNLPAQPWQPPVQPWQPPVPPRNPSSPAVPPIQKKDAFSPLTENTPLPVGVLAPGPIPIDDLRVTRFRLATEQMLPCLRWSADGKSFFCLDKSGTLRRLALDSFRELKVRSLGGDCLWMSPSAAGLLVSISKPGGGQIVVVDPDTLDTRQTYPMPEGYRAVSAPSFAGAYVGPGKDGLAMHSLGVLDLNVGRYLAQYQMQRGRIGPFPRDAGWTYPVLSEDGHCLYCVAGNGGIVRWKVNGPQIVCEQISEDLIHGCNCRRVIQLSPGGQWVCMPTTVGNERGPITYLYASDNLASPALRISGGWPANAIGLDPVAQRIFSQDRTYPLIVRDSQGVKQKSYRFNRENEESFQFLVHPQGRKLVILGQRGLYYVEMP